MAATRKFYNRYIATGSGILIVSVFFATIFRVLYFINFGITNTGATNGYLWQPISYLFDNPYISFFSCITITGILALLASHINAKHLLIRQKTLLPPTFIVLLFSCHPSFIGMSGEYISILLILATISMLFTSYNSEKKQYEAFKISFVLALASLFTTTSIIYFPILWISLMIMRSFNFKAFIASFIGVFIIYFPVFSFYLLTDNLSAFTLPFRDITASDFSNLPIFSYGIKQWIIIGFSLVLFIIIIGNGYINRHKDKIKVRAYLSLLSFIFVFSMIVLFTLNINPLIHLFMALLFGAFILSHFFALIENKASVILFYISILVYFIICFLPYSI